MHDFKTRERTSDGQRLDTSRAIATAYRGYEFRSRLEAKYAHFFDLCGWAWSYEPIDMGGWIPDFAIGEIPTLVEIKPFFQEDQFAEAKAKAFAAGLDQPLILLGADPAWLSIQVDVHDGIHFGWIMEPHSGNWTTSKLHFGLTGGNGKPGLCPMDSGWFNYIWNLSSKPARVDVCGLDLDKFFVQKWAQACNVAKWVPIKEPTE
jgi:hypothetical protein